MSQRFAAVEWPSGIHVDDDDFGYDASLKITGDFATKKERMAYARAVAKALNAADIPKWEAHEQAK